MRVWRSVVVLAFMKTETSLRCSWMAEPLCPASSRSSTSCGTKQRRIGSSSGPRAVSESRSPSSSDRFWNDATAEPPPPPRIPSRRYCSEASFFPSSAYVSCAAPSTAKQPSDAFEMTSCPDTASSAASDICSIGSPATKYSHLAPSPPT